MEQEWRSLGEEGNGGEGGVGVREGWEGEAKRAGGVRTETN